MLSKVLASFAIFGLIGGVQAEAQVNVNGYTKSNGTYVQPHVRTKPDGNPYNNYSSPGGSAAAICQRRAEVYEAARQANPTRWSGATRCWSQPAEVWINKPTEEHELVLELPLIKAA